MTPLCGTPPDAAALSVTVMLISARSRSFSAVMLFAVSPDTVENPSCAVISTLQLSVTVSAIVISAVRDSLSFPALSHAFTVYL